VTSRDLESAAYDAIILAGGAGTRLGGVDKSAIDVAGRSMLDRVLAACSDARAVVIVGKQQPTGRPVQWTIEHPPRGGPLPGLAAGLTALPANAGAVVVLACDLPYVRAADVTRLLRALPGFDAAVFTDPAGVAQPLAAAFRAAALHAAVGTLGDVRGQPMRRILDVMRTVTVDDRGASRDCDTQAHLDGARMALR
jgi:molybdopterin-guanine dinucleotide biosynthesis protein A